MYICLSLCYVLSEPSSGTSTMDGHFLKKYGKITLQGSKYGDYFYFNTEDFKDGEEIYFKVRAIEEEQESNDDENKVDNDGDNEEENEKNDENDEEKKEENNNDNNNKKNGI